ncbi:hypothetical protein [Bradyrhizobium erythrophlei]|nr:hypothetical protein [Bradyrhizobium erythrophlei]
MADEIVLAFHFDTPPPADGFGDVFVALARDYNEATEGRVLVIKSIQSGSIIVALTDAALAAAPYAAGALVVIGAANAVATFAKNLKEWFGRAKSDEGRKRLYRRGKKAPGQRSVEAIITVAAKNGLGARVKYTSPKGEVIEAELTPAQAVQAVEMSATRPTKLAEIEAKQRRALARPDVMAALEKLRDAGNANLSPVQIESLIDIIVAALELAGAEYALPSIAAHLEMHGMHEFAKAVRKHIKRPGGTLAPPITTR